MKGGHHNITDIYINRTVMLRIVCVIYILLLGNILYGYSQVQDTIVLGGDIKAAAISVDKVYDRTSTNLTLTKKDVVNFPSLFSESDPLKLTFLIPGIQNNSEGDANISIRGGEVDQNLITLDNIPIYSPVHIKGLTSVLNSDIVGYMDVYKDGFPAKFGSRLSGVVSVFSKEGDFKDYHGNITLGLQSGKFMLEGSIINDKLSFVLSGRVSYLGFAILPLYKRVSDRFAVRYIDQFEGSNYYDINAKLTYLPSKKDKISFTFYNGSDYVAMPYERYGNLAGNVMWDRKINSKNSISFYINGSKFNDYQIVGNLVQGDYEKKNSNIAEFSVGGSHLIRPMRNFTLEYGAKYMLQYINPTTSVVYSDTLYSTIGEKRELQTFSLYLDDEWNIANWLDLSAGVRFNLYAVGCQRVPILEPRVRVSVLPIKDLSIKATYSKMSQSVFQLRSNNVTAPSDIWISMDDFFSPQVSDIYSIGVFYKPKIFEVPVAFSVESYYKQMSGLVEYSERYYNDTVGQYDEVVEIGKGHAYGVEFNMRKDVGEITGLFSYTWSKSIRQFDGINGGLSYFSDNDCRHNIGIYLTKKFGDRFDISLSFVYKTGKWVTLTDIRVYSNIGYEPERYLQTYSKRNSIQLEDYHRLDLGMNYYIPHKFGKSHLNFSIYNLYNKQNPYLLFLYTKTSPYVMKQLCLFPFMPSLSYSFEF